MDQSELSELIAKCREGDPQAQEQLVLAVQEKVRFHCLRMLRDRDRAEDAAQDILIAMLAGLGSLREPNAFWGWLNQITVRCCRKRRARTIRELRYIQEADDALLETLEIQDDQQQPDKRLDTEENRRMIVELVDALPEQQRECVMLYYYQELSIKEVASTLKVPEGTVNSRLHHARRAIKQGVDGYERQGFRLYGLSPLPFIQYFLQQESASVITGSLVPAVLAAAGASAAAGGVAAAAASVKAVLAALGAKKAIAAAVLLVAGAVTGGILLSPEPETPETPPIQAVQPAETGGSRQELLVQPPAVLPERLAPVEQPPLPAEQQPTAPAEHGQAVPLPVVVPAAAEEHGPEALPAVPLEAEIAGEPELPPPATPPDDGVDLFEEPGLPEIPEIAPQVQPEPEPEPEPVQQPNTVPSLWPDLWTDNWFIPGLDTTPDFGENPDPGSDTEPDPEPVVINRDLIYFGASSGYGYSSSFASEWKDPLPGGLEYISSDPDVVRIDEYGQFSTLLPGEAVLTARDPSDPDTEYTLTIQVGDHFDWDFYFSLPEDTVLTVGRTSSCHLQNYTMSTTGYGIEVTGIQWKSSDSDVVDIIPSMSWMYLCVFQGVAPGKATITGRVTFEVETVFGRQTMEDDVSFDITVEEVPFTVIYRELPEFGEQSGYGYTSSFSSAWGTDGELPKGMVYFSSDTSVAVINRAGTFTTLSSGPVELTAFDPDHPDQRYVLALQVQDHLDWWIVFGVPSLSVGDVKWVLFTSCRYSRSISPVSWQWSSDDTSVVEVVETGSQFGWFCRLKGISPGTAILTGVFTIEVQTADGPRTMQDTVSIPVTIT